MSRNGSGVYNLPAGNPVITGTSISSTATNNTLNDIAAAISQSISSDGQTPIVGDIPMNGHKLTGLANGTSSGDALNVGQLAASSGSSLIYFLQAGTGAVGRTVQARLRDEISVKDFGAVGDGVTDDTAAIQAACTAAATYTANVYAPKGIYKLTAQILVPRGVTVIGCGSRETPRWASGAWNSTTYGTVFSIAWGATLTGDANAAFRTTSFGGVDGCNFWYPNQSADTTTPVVYPPTIALASDASEQNNKVMLPYFNNITFVNSWQAMSLVILHEQLHLYDIGISAWKYGIILDQSSDVDIVDKIHMNNTFTYKGAFPTNNMFNYGITVAANGVGLWIGRADAARFGQILVFGFRTGVLLSTITTGYPPTGIYFTDLTVEGNVYCIYMQGFVQNIGISGTCQLQPMPSTVNGVIGIDAIHIDGDSTLKTGIINLVGVNVLSSPQRTLWAKNANFISIDSCQLQNGCGVNQGGLDYSIIMDTCKAVYFDGGLIGVTPQNTNGLFGNFVNCDRFFLQQTYLFGQQNATASYFGATNCTNGRIKPSYDDNVIYNSVLSQSGCTNVTADVPFNR